MVLRYFLFFIILLPYGHDADLAYAQTRSQIQLENKNVLILNAFESNIPAFERTNQGLSAALQSGGIGIRNQFYEHLDLVRNPDHENRKLMTQLISKRHSERNIDLIITLFPESLNFLLEMGPDFFSAASVLALFLPQGFEQPETDRQIISQPGTLDLKRTLEIGLKLVPKAERIYVVNGTHPLNGWLEKILRIAGGSLISFKYIGTKAGELILVILRGVKNIEDIPDVLEVPQVDTYYWLQLKHWHLNESDCPKGRMIINREFSLWT